MKQIERKEENTSYIVDIGETSSIQSMEYQKPLGSQGQFIFAENKTKYK